MKHAEKLNLSINVDNFDYKLCTPHREYTKLQRFSRGLPGKAFGSETRLVPDPEFYINQLPKALLDVEIPYIFLLDIKVPDEDCAVLPAHIDINKTCGINVYLEANGEITKFYNWCSTTRTSTYVEEFCAKQGEVWLMNNQQPHAVKLVRDCQRRILTYSFVKTTYNEVLTLLKCKQ